MYRASSVTATIIEAIVQSGSKHESKERYRPHWTARPYDNPYEPATWEPDKQEIFAEPGPRNCMEPPTMV